MVKRMLGTLFACIVSLSASAYDLELGGIFYDIDGRNATVTYKNTSYNSYSADIVIPESITHNGTTYAVTSIGEHAFYGCSALTSVAIPPSVTSIGSYAFRSCINLADINIPQSVTVIGDRAFFGTALFDDESNWDGDVLYISNCLIKAENYLSGEYTVDEGTRVIACGAFSGCSSLLAVTIPSSVTVIDTGAFEYCRSLTEVNLPNSVTSIGDRAFRDCGNLTTITLPSSLTTIGHGAFNGCSGLKEIIIPSSVTSIGDNTFRDCTGLTEVIIPASVTSIGSHAFFYCRNLTEVTIPGSVTSLGDAPFARCTALTSFSGKFASPDHRCLIVDGTLNSFAPHGLTTYIIPTAVTAIGTHTFSYCTGLKSITLPATVTEIGDSAFDYCAGLKSIYVNAPRAEDITLGNNPFSNLSTDTCVLYVPQGSRETYAAAEQWREFQNIAEFTPRIKGDVTGDNLVNISDITAMIESILNIPNPLADITGDNLVDITDVTVLINIILDD